MNPKAYLTFGNLLLAAAAILVTASAAPAQGRGGAVGGFQPSGGAVGGFRPSGGAVGGFRPGGFNPATRPFVPRNVPASRFGTLPVNAYRPNGGYIPFVGYYLPEAAPYTRPAASGLGSFGEESLADELPKQPAAPGKLIPVEQPGAAATVTVRLLAGAELWFGGTKVPLKGDKSEFRTPVLKSGRLYDYEIRARWKQDGRDVTQTQQVVVTAGAATHVDFTPPAGTAP